MSYAFSKQPIGSIIDRPVYEHPYTAFNRSLGNIGYQLELCLVINNIIVVKFNSRDIIVKFGLACAYKVLPMFEEMYPNDKTLRLCLEEATICLHNNLLRRTTINSLKKPYETAGLNRTINTKKYAAWVAIEVVQYASSATLYDDFNMVADCVIHAITGTDIAISYDSIDNFEDYFTQHISAGPGRRWEVHILWFAKTFKEIVMTYLDPFRRKYYIDKLPPELSDIIINYIF